MRRRERLAQLTPGDLGYALLAPWCFPVAALALRRWGLQRVQTRLAPRGRHVSPAVCGSDVQTARRTAWLVDAVARRTPWPANCLQRSLVLWWFLARRGIAAEIRIGVRRRPGSPSGSRSLDFHAWVELDGLVLNDLPSVREWFATFDRAIVPSGARWRRARLD
jgi:hypothetical protein